MSRRASADDEQKEESKNIFFISSLPIENQITSKHRNLLLLAPSSEFVNIKNKKFFLFNSGRRKTMIMNDGWRVTTTTTTTPTKKLEEAPKSNFRLISRPLN